MTELLYLHDSYVKEFDACVKDVNGVYVILDRSYFHPTSGGLPCDLGKLFSNNGVYEILEVKKIDNIYTIVVDKDGIQKETIVKCKLDWDRRYRLMRVHTATHIMSAIIYNKYNGKITGNQLNLDKSRLDCDALITHADFATIEQQVNEEIKKNHKVEISFCKRKDLEGDDKLVRLAKGIPEGLDLLRVVKIGDVDMQIDGGPHVAETREIGTVKLLDFENRGKNNKRIYFTVVNND